MNAPLTDAEGRLTPAGVDGFANQMLEAMAAKGLIAQAGAVVGVIMAHREHLIGFSKRAFIAIVKCLQRGDQAGAIEIIRSRRAYELTLLDHDGLVAEVQGRVDAERAWIATEERSWLATARKFVAALVALAGDPVVSGIALTILGAGIAAVTGGDDA